MARPSDVIREAREWVGTPFSRQQRLKGLGVDCAGFVAEVAMRSGAVSDISFERDYGSGRGNAPLMLRLLNQHLNFVAQGPGLPADVLPADIVMLPDGRHTDEPQHLAFVTQLAPYPKFSHASERGVVEHRANILWLNRVHSVWRMRNLQPEE